MTLRYVVLVVCLSGVVSGLSQQGADGGAGREDPFAAADGKRAKPAGAGIAFTAEWIEVDLNALPGLLRKHGGEEDSSALYAAVEAMVEAGEATRAEVIYGRLREGSRTVIDSVDEMIYPTDYDPPEIAKPADPVKGEAKDKSKDAGQGELTPAQPTAFETRHVGTTVEIEPSLKQEGQVIELRIMPETVTFRGRDYHVPEDDDSAPLLKLIWQPRFFTARINTVVSVKSGSTTLLGSFKKPVGLKEKAPERQRRLLLFVHAKTLSPGSEGKK